MVGGGDNGDVRTVACYGPGTVCQLCIFFTNGSMASLAEGTGHDTEQQNQVYIARVAFKQNGRVAEEARSNNTVSRSQSHDNSE